MNEVGDRWEERLYKKVYIHPIKNNEVGGRWEIFFEKKVT
jgi:hypothetical protein